jgi:hypothetical protein
VLREHVDARRGAGPRRHLGDGGGVDDAQVGKALHLEARVEHAADGARADKVTPAWCARLFTTCRELLDSM